MLNLTRRERNVITTLVLLYIVGCIIFYGKKFIASDSDVSSKRDSLVVSYQKKVKKIDSAYFAQKESLVDIEITDSVKYPININVAGVKDLQKIKGIGPVTAKKIVEYRDENGVFDSIEELKKVNGIGDKTLEKIKGEVTIE